MVRYGILEVRRTQKWSFVKAFRIVTDYSLELGDSQVIIESTYEIGHKTGLRINKNHEICVSRNGYSVMANIRRKLDENTAKHPAENCDIYMIG